MTMFFMFLCLFFYVFLLKKHTESQDLNTLKYNICSIKFETKVLRSHKMWV